MPEVDAVRPLTDPAHRPHAQPGPEQHPPVAGRSHDHGRDEGHDEEPAAVEERRELPETGEHEHEEEQAGHTRPGDHHPSLTGQDRRGATRSPDDGQRGADAHAHRVRVGTEVEAARIGGPGHVADERADGHRQCREQRPAEGHEPHGARPAPPVGEQGDRGPEDVELLLHRQRPQVLEHGRAADELEVRGLGEDAQPVRVVEQRAREVAAEPGRAVVGDRRDQQGGHGQHGEQCGQQPAGPADVEVLEVDPPGAVELDQQQRGDQEAGEDEEHVHAEESARDPGNIRVVEHHGDDRDRAQAVESHEVGQCRTSDGAALPGESPGHDGSFLQRPGSTLPRCLGTLNRTGPTSSGRSTPAGGASRSAGWRTRVPSRRRAQAGVRPAHH